VRVKIQFVMESLVLTGGIRVVFEHASRLRSRGHDVRLLAPHVRPPSPGRARLDDLKHWWFERWSGTVEDGLLSYNLSDAVVRFDPQDPSRVPSADAVIATAWRTAEWVSAMPARAGTRYYLIQQYEAWRPEIVERVDRTWTLPLRKIVIAGWLERLAAERFGATVLARIPNGVDTDRFHPPASRPGPGLRVAMLYDLAPWKGVEDGIAALWTLHRAHPDLSLVLFGRYRMRHRLPSGARYVRNPRQVDLPGIYQSADLFINSSHSEGFSLVILEAMACGCATVATAVGELPEMGRPGEDYVMVPCGDPAALARESIALLENRTRRETLAAAGLALARSYTWDRACDRLVAALEAV
jgi:glycosyltransferase involved in cell wall biosynthesis